MSQTTAVEARPKVSDFKPLTEITKVDELLKHPAMIDRFKQAMPRHLSPERMLRVCMLAVSKTPHLAQCDIWSLTGAMLSLASLGLEPNTTLGHAYLIPFDKKRYNKNTKAYEVERTDCQVVIGYRGLIDLARRSGNLVSLHADVVYEGDEFSFEYGSNMHLKHIPMGSREKPLWAYAHAKLTDGEAFEVLPYNLVLEIRNQSQGYQAALRSLEDSQKSARDAWKKKSYDTSPWVAFAHEMAAKTMIRRIAKVLPMSIEFMTAVELDQRNDFASIDYGMVAKAPHVMEAIDNAMAQAESGPTSQEDAPAETAEKSNAAPAKKVDAKPAETKATPAKQPDNMPADKANFTLISVDGEELGYDEYVDFIADFQKEMAVAVSRGESALKGFIESQKLEQLTADDKQKVEWDVLELSKPKAATDPKSGMFR